MARIIGTELSEILQGTVGVDDTAVIAMRGKQGNFNYSASGWSLSGTQGSDTLNSIEYVEFLDGTFDLGLGATTQIPGNNYVVSNPVVEALSNGNRVVSWTDSNTGAIHLQIFNNANEALTDSINIGAGTFPAIAAMSGGGFAISYTQANATQDIFLQRFDADGLPRGSAIQVNTTTTGTQSYSDVALTANGRLVVVWQDNSVANASVRMQRYDSSGNPLGGEEIVVASNVTSGLDPEVLALSNGRYVVMWSPGTEVHVQAYNPNGTAYGSSVLVSQNFALANSSSQPTMFETADGYGVAWASATGMKVQLFGLDQSPIGSELSLPINFATVHDAVKLASGQIALAFSVDAIAYVQIFSTDGSLIGDRIRIDSDSSLANLEMSALADGGLAIAWQSSYRAGTLRLDANGDHVLPSISGDDGPNTIKAPNFGGITFINGLGYELIGNEGDDILIGSSFGDRLIGGQGADRLEGGTGDDVYVADNLDTIVEGSSGGTDTVRVSGTYVLTAAFVENLVLTGNGAGDLTGNDLANKLTGNGAQNILNGGIGADQMIGLGGNDTYIVDNVGDVVTEAANGGVDTVISMIQSYTLAANVEILRLEGPNALQGYGNALDNQIYGNDGNNDLDGGAGADLLVGGAGNDAYEVDGLDTIIEEENGGIDTVYSTGSWELGDNLENLFLMSGGSWNGTGNTLDNVLYGNEFNNILDGDEGADAMTGGGGNDTYIVDNLGDIVYESYGGGNDTVLSVISFTLGNEVENLTLTGVANIDGTGNNLDNIIRGNKGNNRLDGGYGIDTIYGGAGNDTLVSQYGQGYLYGGTGNDFYDLGTTGTSDTIVELRDQGTDTVRVLTGLSSYTLGLNIENLILAGNAGRGFGNVLDNVIDGNIGSNYLDGGAGDDTMRGQDGNDTYVVDSVKDLVVEELDQGRDEVFASVSYTLTANVENLVLTGSASIDGIGNGLNNRLVGNSAANILLGGDGHDVLIGGGGNDRLDGGSGNDRLLSGTGSDVLQGRAGVDTVSYRLIDGNVTANLAITTMQDTGAGGMDRFLEVENLEGSNTGNDTLTGDANNNMIRGFGGNDVLSGGKGHDSLRGMEGDDILYADAGNDALNGGNGVDTVDFSTWTAAATVDLNLTERQATGAGNDRFNSIENLIGTDFDDVFTGDYVDNALYGGKGRDVLTGDAGNDILDGGSGNDTASYSSSFAGVIVDLANGIADDGFGTSDQLVSIEYVIGSQFDDVLTGDAGKNRLTGDTGRDILRGGGGADTFIYLSVEDSGLSKGTRDIIRDFTNGDLIDLALIDANTATALDDAFHTIIGSNQDFTAAGQLKLVDGILYGNVDNDAQAEFSIDLNGVASLSLTDFVL